jgi:hypothetical protein
MLNIKNTSNALSLSGLHYLKQRRIVIMIGAILMTIGFFGAISVGSIVINDTANNKLTPQGYPETQFLGISAYSYEYGLAFTTILGMFIFFGGIFMDSKPRNNISKK